MINRINIIILSFKNKGKQKKHKIHNISLSLSFFLLILSFLKITFTLCFYIRLKLCYFIFKIEIQLVYRKYNSFKYIYTEFTITINTLHFASFNQTSFISIFLSLISIKPAFYIINFFYNFSFSQLNLLKSNLYKTGNIGSVIKLLFLSYNISTNLSKRNPRAL